MQINSRNSKTLASSMFRAAGNDWSIVREASRVREDGVRVIDRSRLDELRRNADRSAAR